ncbi:hypothetical protein ACQ86D_26450 [Streptomyces galilaeus]
MGQITPAVRASYGRHAYVCDWIPTKILDRIDDGEVLDRLDEARDLIQKADSGSPDLCWSYRQRARDVLEAAPRDEVEHQAAGWITKAQSAHTAVHAAYCRSVAQQLREKNPPAPRRERVSPAPQSPRMSPAKMLLKAEIKAAVQAACDQPDGPYAAGLRQLDALSGRLDSVRGQVTELLVKADRPDLVKVL